MPVYLKFEKSLFQLIFFEDFNEHRRKYTNKKLTDGWRLSQTGFAQLRRRGRRTKSIQELNEQLHRMYNVTMNGSGVAFVSACSCVSYRLNDVQTKPTCCYISGVQIASGIICDLYLLPVAFDFIPSETHIHQGEGISPTCVYLFDSPSDKSTGNKQSNRQCSTFSFIPRKKKRIYY